MLPDPSFMFCLALSFMAQSTGIPDSFSGSVVQYGALTLCAYMVIDNKRDRDRMARAAEADKQELLKQARNTTQALQQSATAMDAIAKAIKGCPENQKGRGE